MNTVAIVSISLDRPPVTLSSGWPHLCDTEFSLAQTQPQMSPINQNPHSNPQTNIFIGLKGKKAVSDQYLQIVHEPSNIKETESRNQS